MLGKFLKGVFKTAAKVRIAARTTDSESGKICIRQILLLHQRCKHLKQAVLYKYFGYIYTIASMLAAVLNPVFFYFCQFQYNFC
jgi:hypothetical protein